MAQPAPLPDIGYGPGIRAPDADTGHGVKAWIGSDKLSPADIDALVKTTAGEGANQAPLAQQYIASTILNRSRLTGKSVSDIASDSKQYEGANNSVAQKATPGSDLHAQVLNNIGPVIQNGPVSSVTHFVNPILQAADGREYPAWGKGGDGVKIGDQVYFDRSKDIAKTSSPSDSDFVNATTGNATPAPPAGAPSDNDFINAANAPQPSPVGTSQSPGYQTALSNIATKSAAIDAALKQNPNSGQSALEGGFTQGLTANTLPLIAGSLAGLHAGINNFLYKNFGVGAAPTISMADAFGANRQFESDRLGGAANAHPILNAAGNTAGFVASPITKAFGLPAASTKAALIARGGLGALAKRAGIGALETGAAGATAGAGQAASEGGSPSQIGENALRYGVPSAMAGGAGEAVAPLVAKGSEALAVRAHPALKPLAKLVTPTIAGSLIGGAIGGKQGAILGGIGGLALGSHLGNTKEPIGEISPEANNAALEHIAKTTSNGDLESTASNLENSKAHTVAESFPNHTTELLKTATKENPNAVAPLQEQVAARQHPDITVAKLGKDVEGATGVNPAHAQMSAEDYLAQKKAENQKVWQPVNENASNPVNTPEHKHLLETQPIVRSAVRQAQDILGDKGHAPNPNFETPAQKLSDLPQHEQDELAREAFSKGAVTLEDLKSPDYADKLQNYLDDKNGASHEPETLPTQEAWTLAKRRLNHQVSRDQFGNAKSGLASSEVEGTTNQQIKNLAQRVNEANKQHFEGLDEAQKATGEEFSFEQNKELGSKLNNNKNSETPESFAKRFETLSEPDKEATRHGYLQEFFRQYRDNPTATINKYLNDSHKSYQKTLFEDGGKGFQEALQSSLDSARQAKEITDFKSSSKEDKPIAIPTAVLGGAASGIAHGLSHAVSGAFAGLKLGLVAHALAPVGEALAHGEMTPEVQQALANKLAQSPQQTAQDIRELKAKKQNMPMSKSTVMQDITKHAFKGVGYLAGRTRNNAFSGVDNH